MKVAITGATGFIGKNLIAELRSNGIESVVITRDASRARKSCPDASGFIEWSPPEMGPDPAGLDGLDGVVNLAGATVAQRWTEDAKKRIYDSRILSTRLLVDALGQTSRKPGVLVSNSAIGYYGPRDDTRLAEDAAPGGDFLSRVCRDWEAEAGRASELGIRVSTPRVGIVLGKGGGALANMLTPFRLGVGGPIGDGRQWMSWIHMADVTGLIREALANPQLSGPVNATAPEPVRNKEFSKTLGSVLSRPAILPTPVFALKLMFGEFAEILATGQRVVPSKALGNGFRFRHPELREALADVV